MESAVHLGHVLNQTGTMDMDIKSKRASFIDDSTEIRETFSFASPVEVLAAVKLYAGSHYGSMLWDLGSSMADQYFHAWNVCVKLAWQVPRATRTFFVDNLLSCGLSTARMDILARYSKFMQSLRASPSMEVAVMFGVASRDVRTTTGSNLRLLRMETGLDIASASPRRVKAELVKKLAVVPDIDKWRLPYLARLLEDRGELHYNGGETDHLTSLIDSLCVN